MSELLISIGVAEYQNKIFSNLPGARNDALRICSYFNLWGINQNNIITLIDSQATKENILNAIRVEPLRREVDTVFIYYAGHGEINKEDPSQPENILYCYDTYPADKVGTGLKIKEIVDGIQRCKPIKVFLFIDACYVQLTDFPAFYLDSTNFDEEKKCFFSLISTWGKQTYETIKGGAFTTLLLQGIASLRSKNPICLHLASYVESKARQFDLPCPKGYWIGNSNVWLLDTLKPDYMCELDGNVYVDRKDSLVYITDKILLEYNKSIFCFYGKAKSGKTILALEFKKQFPSHSYYSIENYNSIEYVKSGIAQCIYNIIKESHIKLDISCNDLNSVIKLVKNCGLDLSLILDHAERLEQEQFDSILDELECENIVIIAFSRTPLSSNKHLICNYQHPDFSKNEFEKFLEQHGISDINQKVSLYYDTYKSKPQALVQKLLNLSEYDIFVACKKEVYYICECNGFINIDLFANKFNLKSENLFKLINCGLVRKHQNYYLPHESLFDYFNYNKNAFLISLEAEDYWINQLINSPKNEYACVIMLKLIENKSGNWLGENVNEILKILVSHFINQYNWSALETIYPLLIKNKQTDLLIHVSTQLAHVASSIILQEDTKIRNMLSSDHLIEWEIIKSEVLFWKGDFSKCIELSNILLHNKTLNTKYYHTIKLNLGISYFFLGEWDFAVNELNDINTNEERISGWKILILGTIYAIRGVDFDKGIDYLNNCISKLKKINDVIGLGIAYVNLGECLYKKGDFDMAQYYLDLADELTIVSHDNATRLEILKNKLLLYLCKNHTFDGEAISIKKDIIDLLDIVTDKTELMQVYNALALAAAYNYEISILKQYVNLANNLTVGNLEYELYTYINKIIISYIENNFEETEYNINYFYKLAHIGNNFFAMKQCINSVYDIQHLYNLKEIQCNQWIEMKGELYEQQ